MTNDFLCPFKNSDICNNIQLVDYKEEWHKGKTGYIDGIQPSDDIFSSSPLAKFIDEFGRSAIAIKYTVFCPEEENNKNAITPETGEYAVAAFQRYTDQYSIWVYGGHYKHPYVPQTVDGTIEWLESLIHNGSKTFITNKYYNHIGCSAALEDFSITDDCQPSADNSHPEFLV